MTIKRPGFAVLSIIGVTLFTVWLALNLSLGDKPFDHRFARLYTVEDKQFARTMVSSSARLNNRATVFKNC